MEVTSITYRWSKDRNPEFSIVDFRNTPPKFISLEFTSKQAFSRLCFFVDSARDVVAFKNSVNSACEQFLKEDYERRQQNG